jgi:tRNA1(Val) A37 N6-methylase TrmN6
MTKVINNIILKRGGDQVVIQIGNTIIDIMHGYQHSKDVPCAIVDIYPFEDEKPYRVLVNDDKITGVICK